MSGHWLWEPGDVNANESAEETVRRITGLLEQRVPLADGEDPALSSASKTLWTPSTCGATSPLSVSTRSTDSRARSVSSALSGLMARQGRWNLARGDLGATSAHAAVGALGEYAARRGKLRVCPDFR
jgi:hypothetical protein